MHIYMAVFLLVLHQHQQHQQHRQHQHHFQPTIIFYIRNEVLNNHHSSFCGHRYGQSHSQHGKLKPWRSRKAMQQGTVRGMHGWLLRTWPRLYKLMLHCKIPQRTYCLDSTRTDWETGGRLLLKTDTKAGTGPIARVRHVNSIISPASQICIWRGAWLFLLSQRS